MRRHGGHSLARPHANQQRDEALDELRSHKATPTGQLTATLRVLASLLGDPPVWGPRPGFSAVQSTPSEEDHCRVGCTPRATLVAPTALPLGTAHLRLAGDGDALDEPRTVRPLPTPRAPYPACGRTNDSKETAAPFPASREAPVTSSRAEQGGCDRGRADREPD